MLDVVRKPAHRKFDWIAGAHALLGAQIILVILLDFGLLGSPRLEQADFVSSYAAGHFADNGRAALAYDIVAQSDFQHALAGPSEGSQVFFYPPIHLLLCGALAALPYPVAFGIWVCSTVMLLLFGLRRICGSWSLSLALLSFPTFWTTASLGQNAFFTAGLFAFGTSLLEENPTAAGISLGLLCYKPQLAMLVPLALFFGRYWRALSAFLLTVAALIVATTAAFGFDLWKAFIEGIPVAQSIYLSGTLGFWAQTSIYSSLRLIGVTSATASIFQALTLLASAMIVALVWWRSASLPIKSATLIGATLLAVPTSLSYDLMPACVAVAWLMTVDPRSRQRVYLVSVVWLCAGLGVYVGKFLEIPVLPLAALAVLAMAYSVPPTSSNAVEVAPT